mmetsp:Transcript_41457/g.68236  ORF Transcript_41457/g.68236 Transcript_41457/m.68236 type:complete len:273 (+) Transcript_41457:1394-2212(+)
MRHGQGKRVIVLKHLQESRLNPLSIANFLTHATLLLEHFVTEIVFDRHLLAIDDGRQMNVAQEPHKLWEEFRKVLARIIVGRRLDALRQLSDETNLVQRRSIKSAFRVVDKIRGEQQCDDHQLQIVLFVRFVISCAFDIKYQHHGVLFMRVLNGLGRDPHAISTGVHLVSQVEWTRNSLWSVQLAGNQRFTGSGSADDGNRCDFRWNVANKFQRWLIDKKFVSRNTLVDAHCAGGCIVRRIIWINYWEHGVIAIVLEIVVNKFEFIHIRRWL